MKRPQFQANIFKLLVRALKWPIIVFISGCVLSNLQWVNLFYDVTLWNNWIRATADIGNALVALSFVLYFYLFITAITKEYEEQLSASHHRVKAHVLSVLRKGFRIIFAYIAIYTILSIFELKHHSIDVAHKVIALFFVGTIAWIALQVLSTVEVFYYHQYASAKDGDFRTASGVYTKIHLIRNIIVVIVVILAVASGLMVFDSVRSIGISILASAGFLTAIIGLAAQKTLGSMFAGVQLAFSQTFRIGDSIIVDNDIGVVEELTLSYVIVKFWDSRRVILPISYFIEKPFTNLSRDPHGIAGSIKLYVDYVLPIEPLRQQLNKILSASSLWDKRIANLSVSNFRETVIELTIKLSATNPDRLNTLSGEVREQLLEFMHQHYPEGFPKVRQQAQM